jgi:hypothetical protein
VAIFFTNEFAYIHTHTHTHTHTTHTHTHTHSHTYTHTHTHKHTHTHTHIYREFAAQEGAAAVVVEAIAHSSPALETSLRVEVRGGGCHALVGGGGGGGGGGGCHAPHSPILLDAHGRACFYLRFLQHHAGTYADVC